MSISPRLQQLLEEFTQKDGAGPAQITADDLGVAISWDPTTVIRLREDSARDVIILAADLPLPSHNQRSRYHGLLTDSLFAPDFDMAFAMNAAGTSLLVQGAFDFAVVNQTRLAPVLAKFVKTHADYRARLRETRVQAHGRAKFSTLGVPILGPQLFA